MNTVENLLAKRALKRYGDLRNPKILPFSTLEFPRKPLIHIQPVDKDDIGLTPTHPIVNCFDPEEDLYVNQVISFTGMQLPKMYFHNAARNPADGVKGYFRRYTQLNRVFKVPTAMASHFPIINNYGLLGGLWVKPIRDVNANLVWNAALYENVLRTSIAQQEYKRPQFILFDIPELLPSFQKILDLVSRESLTEYRKNFAEYKCSSLVTLLLWFTNAPKLQDRTMILNGIHDKLDGFIILRDNENSILLSVDLLKAWREDGGSTPASRLKDFYNLLESMVELRVSIDEESAGDLIGEDTSGENAQTTPASAEAGTEIVNVDSTAYIKVIDRQVEKGKLTTANYNRLIKKAESFKTIPNPVGEGTLADLLTDNPDNWKAVPTVYPDSAVIKHKGWLEDNISNLEGNYVAKQFEADLAGMAMMIQAAGYPVTNYTRELQADALSTKYLYKIKVEPPVGSSSTLPFTIPAIDENGEYQIDGVRQRNDRQIGEKPIIKIAPTEVVLTAAMCKTFIQRCPRANFNFTDWIGKQINIKAADGTITETATSSFDNTVKAPFHYTVLTHQYSELKVGGTVLNMRSHLDKETADFSEGIVFGKTADGLDIKMLADCSCIAINKKGEEVRDLGTVAEILGLPSDKAPREFATLKFWRKEIPVGVFISYLIGIEAFLSRVGVAYTLKEKGERHVVTGNEYVIKFKDKLLIVTPTTVTQELLVYGFEYYKANLVNYRFGDFKDRTGFTGLLGTRGLTVDHLMELDLFETNFIDPICRRLLAEMNEPTEYLKLLVRAVSLLEYEQHRVPSDGYNYIDKGYSRLTEIAYREFMQGVRQFRRANARDTAKLTINPNAVARKISEDAAGTLIEEINPLHSTTERERCTFNGDGGRKPGVVNGELRRFSVNDIGRVSEANVDNGNVGSIRWTSANPRYKNAYGMAETYEENKDVDAANVLSPYAMLMPYSTHDDMKRAVFGRIQMGSWIPTSGCSPFPIRTAFEDLIAYRAGKKYAFAAKQDGVIKVITDTAMSISYKDGTTESCRMGVWFGTVPGKKIQHENVTDRKEGYRFKAGEILMWNKYFFCRSWMVPTRCSFMTGALALVAWSETLATDEDGSRYSDKLSMLLTTPKVYERTIKATFSDDVVGLVKVGDEVEYDTVLCSIVPSQANVSDIKDASTLADMGNIAPKAETAGHVTAIEVYYRGDLVNASDTVKKIIREDNRKRKATALVMKSGTETGELTVSSPYGTKIFDEALHIKIYITHDMPFEEGDKYVVSNQLKSVPGQSFEQKLFTTNSGEFVDVQFSYKAAKARIVWSYNKGVIAIIVRQICRNAVRVALGEKPMKNTGEPQHVPV